MSNAGPELRPDDVPVRDAATVVLLRDGVVGVEVWLLTRVVGMQFAAGMSVFPGGRVDDADSSLPISAGDIATMAARFGCDEETMHALVGAAVRETFEETGVLLTVPAADLSHARADVERGLVSFGELLLANRLSIDASVLHPWSRWVTPKGEVRRYDTRFFVGRLPEGAEAANVTSESSAAEWLPIGLAIEQAQRGQRQLLPPTMLTLVALADCASVAEVFTIAETSSLEPVRPKLIIGADRSITVELPDGRLIPIRPGAGA
ncbi:MAG: NUDIX hydrolase [Jatrophihabitans sp.]